MSKYPKYEVTIDDEYSDGEDLGIDLITYTKNPAIKIKGLAFKSQELPKYTTFKDSLKYRIAAPAIIPGDIYRNDDDGEYFVEFTEKEIEKMAVKFMKKLGSSKNQIFNLEHTDEMVPAYVLEVWLVTDPEKDKSFYEYGIKVPKGTLFVVSQFTDKDYYNKIVSEDRVGYSIEGFLGLKLSEFILEDAEIHPNCRCTIVDGKITTEPGACDFCISVKEENNKKNFSEILKINEEINYIKMTENTKKDLLTKLAKLKEMEKEINVLLSEDDEKEELTEEVKEEELTEEVKEEELTEEVKEEELEEEVKEEELTEEVKEEELEEVVEMEDYQPKFDEIYEMIAELKAEIAELKGVTVVEEELEKDDKVELSSKLSQFFTHFKK